MKVLLPEFRSFNDWQELEYSYPTNIMFPFKGCIMTEIMGGKKVLYGYLQKSPSAIDYMVETDYFSIDGDVKEEDYNKCVSQLNERYIEWVFLHIMESR